MDAKEIIAALDGPTDVYQREAVQAAMDQPDEIVPLLLAHLEEVLAEPERFTDPDDPSQLPAYALILLSHLRIREAHRLLVDLLSLPGETPLDLFGDLVHENFPIALWKTSGVDITAIKGLIQNKATNEYCRAAAIRALLYGIAEGELSREEVVEYLQGIFTGDEAAREEYMFRSVAASALSRLWPGESMKVLRKAFNDGLIDTFFIGPENIEAALEAGKESCLATFESNALKDLVKDPHQSMSWWACFNPQQSSRGGRGQGQEPKRRLSKNVAKRKRKQAKAARKKECRRKKR